MSLPRRPESSLRQSLLLLTMFTSGIGMTAGYTAFFLYDMHSARTRKVADLEATAKLIGTNATTALVFDDGLWGAKVLEALRIRNDMRRGILFRADDSALASYPPRDVRSAAMPGRGNRNGVEWKKDYIAIDVPVTYGAKEVGSIYLEADLKDLRDRQHRFEQVTVLVAGCSLLLCWCIFQRSRCNDRLPRQFWNSRGWRVKLPRTRITDSEPRRGRGASFVNWARISITCWRKSSGGTRNCKRRATRWSIG